MPTATGTAMTSAMSDDEQGAEGQAAMPKTAGSASGFHLEGEEVGLVGLGGRAAASVARKAAIAAMITSSRMPEPRGETEEPVAEAAGAELAPVLPPSGRGGAVFQGIAGHGAVGAHSVVGWHAADAGAGGPRRLQSMRRQVRIRPLTAAWTLVRISSGSGA